MLLNIENASFSYKAGNKIIDNLNFCAEKGDLIAILGPNGAGKTTLLRCIMSFLKFDSGKSILDGKDISKIPSTKLWREISYVPQAKHTNYALTAEEMILLGLTSKIGIFSSPTEHHVQKVREIAESLKISYLLDKQCDKISGGELQMVLIARAIISEPKLLILDEPESNLDFRNQLIVLDAISNLAAKGICVIFNTHYPEHALTRANKSLILYKGGKTIFGETHKVVTEENIKAAFGVKTVISEVETKGNIYKSIMPIKLSDSVNSTPVSEDKKAIAIISVIFSDYSLSARINGVFSKFSDYIIGRMGMPYNKGEVYIINVTVDGFERDIESMKQALSILPGVNVKATVAERNTYDKEID